MLCREFRISYKLQKIQEYLEFVFQRVCQGIDHFYSKTSDEKQYLTRKFYSELKSFQKNFIITGVDKAGELACYECRNSHEDTLNKAIVKSSHYQEQQQSTDDILAGWARGLKEYGIIVKGKFGIPIAKVLRKFHKANFDKAHRLLCAGNRSMGKIIEGMVQDALQLLVPGLDLLWMQVCSLLCIQIGENQIPIVTLGGEKGYSKRITDINRFLVEEDKKVPLTRKRKLISIDVSSCYPSLKHEDLKERIHFLLDKIWENIGRDKRHIFCMNKKTAETRWECSYLPPEENPGWQCFSLLAVKSMVDFVIDHAYTQVFGKVYRQTTGIGMGQGSSPIFCLYFVFSCLYRAMLELACKGNRKHACCLACTNNFMDDFENSDRELFLELLLGDVLDEPLFPEYLEISIEEADEHGRLCFLSRQVYFSRRTKPKSVLNVSKKRKLPISSAVAQPSKKRKLPLLTCRSFPKTRQPKFERIVFNKYPSLESHITRDQREAWVFGGILYFSQENKKVFFFVKEVRIFLMAIFSKWDISLGPDARRIFSHVAKGIKVASTENPDWTKKPADFEALKSRVYKDLILHGNRLKPIPGWVRFIKLSLSRKKTKHKKQKV